MASSSLDSSRGGKPPAEEAKPADNGKGPAKPADNGKPAETPEAAAPAGKGFKAWLPLIAAVITMPALAFATTRFFILPKLERDLAVGKPPGAAGGGEAKTEGKEEKGGSGKVKIPVNLNKILVNVAGTMGTRYLMTSLTLVGTSADFATKIEENKPQLLDLANGTLSTKTISDLEKPGARNVIRAELTTVFNNALGGPLVQEIYITELAIQ
jgi:flagellar FliL protein